MLESTADDLPILPRSRETAVKQLNMLKEQAEKAGLLISFEKTEYITNIRTAPHRLATEYGKIEKVDSFRCLDEIVQMRTSKK